MHELVLRELPSCTINLWTDVVTTAEVTHIWGDQLNELVNARRHF